MEFENSFIMSVAWLVIVLFGLSSSSGNFLEILDESPIDHDLEKSLFSLLERLHREEPYDTLLIYGKDCVLPHLLRNFDMPAVVLSSENPNLEWNLNSLVLILSCHSSMDFGNKTKTRDKLQMNRRLILVQEDTMPEELCQFYANKEHYNVAMVRRNLFQTNIIYSCREFQEAYFEEINLSDSQPIYIENFSDMQGGKMVVMGSEITSASMAYMDPKTGKKNLKGFCANLVTNFALRMNASLKIKPLIHKYNLYDLEKGVEERHLDFAIAQATPAEGSDLDTASYPFMITKLCTMLPLPEKIPHKIIYLIILDRFVVGILFIMFCLLSSLIIYTRTKSWQDLRLDNILINDVGLRGLLGQSFPFPPKPNRHMKLIFFILFFASIMITTMYTAYLNALFTHPPYRPLIRSFNDLQTYNQKLAITKGDVKILTARENVAFLKISTGNLYILESMPELNNLRESLNTSYGYLVPESQWSIFAERQRTFKEPLFYFSTDLCLYKTIVVSIPLRRDLPYRHIFENHILSQNEFGLIEYWIRRSYSEMLTLGLVPHKDVSPLRDVNASIVVNDISGILTLYVDGMAVSILCFFIEIGIRRMSCFRLWKWRKSRHSMTLTAGLTRK